MKYFTKNLNIYEDFLKVGNIECCPKKKKKKPGSKYSEKRQLVR
jgi:hypothetical protein